MNKLFIFGLLLGMPMCAGSKPVTKTINLNWTFNYMPEGTQVEAQHIGFDDSQWPVVAIPHTWSTFETTGDIHPFILYPAERDDPYWWTGFGWYRKRFEIDSMYRDKKIFIEFDGVQKHSRVWLNGQSVGEHKGGFTSFYLDLTDHIRFDQENVLVVRVSNRRDDPERIPPMTAGNWNVYGGIYRDVRLVIKDRLFSPFQGAWQHQGGVFITTPWVRADKATVSIRTWVKNEYSNEQLCRVVTTMLDADERIVAETKKVTRIPAGELLEIDHDQLLITDPHLWSPDHPYLYRITSRIYKDEELVDVLENPLGFRWFEWNEAEDRLILNGKKIHIHGTNLHQEYPWIGDAKPKWLTLEDLMDIRYGLHHNFIRGAHYPHDRLFYDFCDEHGIIVAEEVPNIKSIDFSEKVQEQNVREMIRRDRNHPSIMFWSMGNETNDAADSRWAWEEDTTRIIHARHVDGNSAGDYVTHTDEQMDMENLLRCTIRGWTHSDVKAFEPVPNQHTGHEEWQHLKARVQDGSQRGRIDMGNGVMWIYADHGADREYVNAPIKHVNPKGWVDVYRFPKYLYFLWQANYDPDPVIFVHPHYWQPQYAGQRKAFVVDSNCDEVELFVDNKSYGIQHPCKENFHTVTFVDIPVKKGTLRVVGKRKDQVVTHEIAMPGHPAKVVLSSSHKELEATLASIAVISVDIVDVNGHHVPGAHPDFKWSVEGPATLIGPEIYTSDIDKYEEYSGTMYIDAPVRNLIRSTGDTGKITVRCVATGLPVASVTIQAQKPTFKVVKGVSEPKLNPVGRKAVKRPQRTGKPIGAIEQEIKPTVFDIQMDEKSVTNFETAIRDTLSRRNPNVDPRRTEFKALTQRLGKILLNNGGELVADDYNFIVHQYNECREITRFIDSMDWDDQKKIKLIKRYANRMILDGERVDIGREIASIKSR